MWMDRIMHGPMEKNKTKPDLYAEEGTKEVQQKLSNELRFNIPDNNICVKEIASDFGELFSDLRQMTNLIPV